MSNYDAYTNHNQSQFKDKKRNESIGLKCTNFLIDKIKSSSFYR